VHPSPEQPAQLWAAPPTDGHPPAKSLRARIVPILAGLLALAVVAAGVETWQLFVQKGEYRDVVAELNTTQGQLADAEKRASDAGDSIRNTQNRLDQANDDRIAAEQRVTELEAQVVDLERGNRGNRGNASNEAAFVQVVGREIPDVPDADLIDAGKGICDFLDSVGGTQEDLITAVSSAIDQGFTQDQAAALVGGAVYAFCPEYQLD